MRHLRAVAGSAFARGEAYWRNGHVVAYTVTGDAIDGVVIGKERYHAQLSASGGFLSAGCTCPVGAAICKHAVALGLAFLHEDGAAGPRQATLAVLPGAAAASSAN